MPLHNCQAKMRNRFVFFAVIGLLCNQNIFADVQPTRLIFTGDILLAREVAREIKYKKGLSPWHQMKSYFSDADWVQGNLEGSVGDAKDCVDAGSSLCFATSGQYLRLLKDAGFTSIGVENNHSADLGDSGRANTRASLTAAGLSALSFEESPGFFRSGGHVISFITLSNVAGKDGKKISIPSNRLRQKIRLAKSLSNWVVIYIHWGEELADWPQPDQRRMAEWLVSQGVDLILGHHPHVVQNAECIHGKPVFFSLGNHVFDQKYPNTKTGMMAECLIDQNVLSCNGIQTITPANSSFPEVAPLQDETATHDKLAMSACKVQASQVVKVDGYSIYPKLAHHQFVDGDVILEGARLGETAWMTVAKRVLSLEPGRFITKETGKEMLFTLEKHTSSIDQEDSPRPYVYEITSQGLVAKWRGSALAWPLFDAVLLHNENEVDYLCALHRNDSFLLLNPASIATRTAVYNWNGFGFSGLQDTKQNSKCQAVFDQSRGASIQ